MTDTPSLTLWQHLRRNSHYFLGSLLFKSGIAGANAWLHEKTMRQIQRAADLHHPDALVLFGQLLQYRGVTPYNRIAGVGYLRRAAQNGNASAQFLLAEALVRKAFIVAREPGEDPVNWYLQAGKQGYIMAALRLSKIYHNGLYGQKVDEAKAQHWRDQFMSNSGIDK